MSDARAANKQIVNDFFDYVNRGEISKAFDLVDETVVWWVPGKLSISGFKTKDEYRRTILALKRNFPKGFNLHVTASLAEANMVSVEVESHGEHAGGQHYNNKYHFFFEIEHGKIIAAKENIDTLNLYDLLEP